MTKTEKKQHIDKISLIMILSLGRLLKGKEVSVMSQPSKIISLSDESPSSLDSGMNNSTASPSDSSSLSILRHGY